MRNQIKTALQTSAETVVHGVRGIGLMLGAYIGGTMSLAIYASSYELRFGLAVIGASCLAFYLLDLAMLRRRPRA